jgi:hypothetical protein
LVRNIFSQWARRLAVRTMKPLRIKPSIISCPPRRG